MKKTVLILACLALPLAALAADAKHHGAQPVASAASAVDNHAAIRASKARGSHMSTCRKEAVDRGLTGVELKTSLAECMKK
jgi:hypothetical protein